MFPAIIEKIKKEISGDIKTEAQVLYLLAQIRKSLEHNIITLETSDTLKFYSDWCLHSFLKGSAAQTILSKLAEVNDFYSTQPVDTPLPTALNDETINIVSLAKFRLSLDEYLRKAGISNEAVSAPEKWNAFLTLYLRIIEDCPLKIRSDKPDSSLTEVTVNISHEPPANVPDSQTYCFTAHWSLTGRDGRVAKIRNHMTV